MTDERDSATCHKIRNDNTWIQILDGDCRPSLANRSVMDRRDQDKDKHLGHHLMMPIVK